MDKIDTSQRSVNNGALSLNSALIVAVLIYLTVVMATYLRFRTFPEITLGAIAVLILPAIALATKSKEFIRNSALVMAVLLTYEALQGVTGALIHPGNVASLAWVDQALVGSNFALDVQRAFASPTITLIATGFYGLHVFLIMIAFVLFWFKNKVVYRGYTYSLVLTSYLALFTFVALPTAPPWMAGTAENLLKTGDTMLPTGFQIVAAALQSGESDLVAAFPSLHAAYATLFSIFMFKLGRKYGLASLPVAGGVYFSIIYLGQHYLVDLLGGIAYAAISTYAIQTLMNRRRNSRLELPPSTVARHLSTT